jgi:hypothetical protein
MRRKTIPDARCSMAKRAVCDLRRRVTSREEKSDSRRGASTSRRLDLKKMMKVEKFGRLQRPQG